MTADDKEPVHRHRQTDRHTDSKHYSPLSQQMTKNLYTDTNRQTDTQTLNI